MPTSANSPSPGLEYVMGFLFSPLGEEVVLIEKKRPLEIAGLWSGVGGKIDPLAVGQPKESAEHAMSREFQEETGLYIKEWRHFCFLTFRSCTVVHCFMAHSERYLEVRSTTDEIVQIFTLGELSIESLSIVPAQRLAPALSWLIPLALDNRRSASVFSN